MAVSEVEIKAGSGGGGEAQEGAPKVRRGRPSAGVAIMCSGGGSGTVCLFTNASSVFWGAILTQVSVKDFESGASPTLWMHEPLGFLSGRFRGAQERWGIPDKEGFAIRIACEKFAHLLIREKGFTIFTDHRNLTYIFNPAGVVASVAKPQADRLERWAMFLRCFTYKVRHIAGEVNVWADMLSRWGAVGF